ncbi:MAG: hypothetical protein Q8R64_08635, partial [Sulfurimicrobium sp.]|nr:hypothetical protein [Sulfurimicrobium sp.]
MVRSEANAHSFCLSVYMDFLYNACFSVRNNIPLKIHNAPCFNLSSAKIGHWPSLQGAVAQSCVQRSVKAGERAGKYPGDLAAWFLKLGRD